jgi:hypothetical protein
VPTVKVVLLALVIAGAWFTVGAGFTVRVKDCVALGVVPLAAVNVIGKLPLAVGVPLSVPVEAVNVTPPGSVPASVSVGAGDPVAVTLNVPAVPTVKAVLFALVIDGAVPVAAGVTVMVFCNVPVPPLKPFTAAAHTVAAVLEVTVGAVQVNVQEPVELGEVCVISVFWTLVPVPAVKDPTLAATSSPVPPAKVKV